MAWNGWERILPTRKPKTEIGKNGVTKDEIRGFCIRWTKKNKIASIDSSFLFFSSRPSISTLNADNYNAWGGGDRCSPARVIRGDAKGKLLGVAGFRKRETRGSHSRFKSNSCIRHNDCNAIRSLEFCNRALRHFPVSNSVPSFQYGVDIYSNATEYNSFNVERSFSIERRNCVSLAFRIIATLCRIVFTR